MLRLLKLHLCDLYMVVYGRASIRLFFLSFTGFILVATGVLFVGLNLAPVVATSSIQVSYSPTTSTLTASATGVEDSTWKNNYANATTSPTCDSSITFGSASSSAKSVSVDSNDDGKWICFTVTNNQNSAIYGKYQVDVTSPVVDVTQHGTNTLVASTASTDLPTTPDWQKKNNQTTSDCDSSTTGMVSGSSFNNAVAGNYYCFSVADAAGNRAYREQSLTANTDIEVNQFATSVVARQMTGLRIDDYFGYSVSLDGDRLAVGASDDDGSGAWYTDSGAVYIFKRTGTTWTLEQEISDQASGFTVLESLDFFGYSVSLDGDRLAVGAYGDVGHSGDATGAVYIFKRTGTNWALEQEISDQETGFDSLWSSDYFGYSVSLDENRLAVGAYLDYGHSGDSTGAAYIFKRTGTTWALEQEISDQETGFNYLKPFDYFGEFLDLDGDRLAVGAAFDDGDNGADAGAVYIFKRTGSTWDLEQEISNQVTGSTGLFMDLDGLDSFGWNVDLDGDRLAVGAMGDDSHNRSETGAAYIFKRTGTTWALEQKISDQSAGLSLSNRDSFGIVALDGDRLAVGAYLDDGSSGADTGAAYIFKRTGTTWVLEQEIADRASGFSALVSKDWFGKSIALDDGRLVVGAYGDNGIYGERGQSPYSSYTNVTGAAYIFEQENATWNLEQEISNQHNIVDNSWQNFKTADSTTPSCSYSDDSSFGTAGSGARVVTLIATDHNKWVCFRAKNNHNVYSYVKHQIDLSPIINITQDSDSVDATALPTANLSTASWQNFMTTNSIEPDCDSNDTFGTASSTANTVSVTSTDNNKWVCFRVKNSYNVYGYAKHKINLSEPRISLSQRSSSVKATAYKRLGADIDIYSWQNFKTVDSDEPTCAVSDNSSFGPAEKTANIIPIDSSDFTKWVCFRVNNNYGISTYSKRQIVRPQPRQIIPSPPPAALVELTITQVGNKLLAAADQADDFSYFVSDTDPNCSGDASQTFASGQEATDLTDRQWVCFKAANVDGVYSYAKAQIDLTPPVITLTQTGSTVTATPPNLTDFGYFVQATEPTCDATNTTSTYTAGASATNLLNDQWVCFKAKNDKEVYGYKEIQVDLKSPTLLLTQVNDTVQATGGGWAD